MIWFLEVEGQPLEGAAFLQSQFSHHLRPRSTHSCKGLSNAHFRLLRLCRRGSVARKCGGVKGYGNNRITGNGIGVTSVT